MRVRFLALTSLSLFACRGGSSHNPDASPDGAGGTRNQDIQRDSMPVGTAVELHGVVVTAIDAFGAKTGDIWVEEPEGGAFSGIHIFGAPSAQVTPLALGDIIDVTGAVKDEFALSTDTSGRTVTELKAAMGGMITLNKTGSGTVPAPQVVDALAIGQMPATMRDAEWEKWEGVLITVKTAGGGVTATSNPKAIGGTTPDPTLSSFGITGVVKVESSLAAFPTPAIKAGDCIASVTGVEDYFFDYLILPRTTAELATGGAGCPAAESSPALCGDGIDNDGNGFADCADNGCIVGASACRAVTTISAIQATTPTTPIELDNVYVTGIASNGFNYWVSTNPNAAVNEGVYVFNAPAKLDASVVPGSKVTIIGKVNEFNDDMMGGTLTEVAPLANTFDTASPATIVPISGKTAAELLMPANAPMYESVQITLTNVNITTLGTSTNGFVATGVQNGTTFKVGTDAVHLAAADVGCHATITGYWTNLEAGGTAATTKPNAFGFIPLTLSPVVPSGCN